LHCPLSDLRELLTDSLQHAYLLPESAPSTREGKLRDGSLRGCNQTHDERIRAQVAAQCVTSSLPFSRAAAIVRHHKENDMGDRSPKSKDRDNKQKKAAQSENAAAAKLKQDGNSRAPLGAAKKK
jgi:hypothetical protein